PAGLGGADGYVMVGAARRVDCLPERVVEVGAAGANAGAVAGGDDVGVDVGIGPRGGGGGAVALGKENPAGQRHFVLVEQAGRVQDEVGAVSVAGVAVAGAAVVGRDCGAGDGAGNEAVGGVACVTDRDPTGGGGGQVSVRQVVAERVPAE